MQLRRPVHLALCAVAGLALPAHDEGAGDQILAGFGETALIARYVFDGDIRDWSRNTLHGEVRGGTPSFGDSEQFGKVLSITAAPMSSSLPRPCSARSR